MLENRLDPVKFFNKSQAFGSLFIFEGEQNPAKIVCEIKVINDGLGEVSFIPLGEDLLLFNQGEEVSVINEGNNISFSATIVANHSNKWITIKIPEKLKMVNLRQTMRFEMPEKAISKNPKISSYGEDGLKKLMEFEGELVDISSAGAGFEIKARRIDGYYKGDVVRLKISDKHTYLSDIPGIVVHKTLCHVQDKESRSYRIGVRFTRKLDLSPVLEG